MGWELGLKGEVSMGWIGIEGWNVHGLVNRLKFCGMKSSYELLGKKINESGYQWNIFFYNVNLFVAGHTTCVVSNVCILSLIKKTKPLLWNLL